MGHSRRDRWLAVGLAKGGGSEYHYSVASADGSPLRPLLSSSLLFSPSSLVSPSFSFWLSEPGSFARDPRRSHDYIVKCTRRRFASVERGNARARELHESRSGERVKEKIKIPEGAINSRRYRRCLGFVVSQRKEERGYLILYLVRASDDLIS